MLSNQSTGLKWAWFCPFIFALDQLTKYLALVHLKMGLPIQLMPFLNFNLAYNKGSAFSILSEAGGWQIWLFATIAIVASYAIFVWLVRTPFERFIKNIALSFILGGALSNLFDRVIHGYVIDFIQLYYQNWTWPTFNVADSFISVGVVLLVIELFREDKAK